MRNIFLGSASALLVAALPATAGAQDWSGMYGGVTTGYVTHDAKHRFSNGAPTGDSSPEGALFGGFLGYAFQSGNTVFGAEASLEGSSASGTFNNPVGLTSGGKAELNWQTTLRGVLGYAGNLGRYPALFYGAVGWSYADFNFQGGPIGGFVGNGYRDELDGWTVAVGVDTRIGRQTSLRVEYAYTDYGSSNGTLAPGFPGVVMPVSVEQHAIRVGTRLDF